MPSQSSSLLAAVAAGALGGALVTGFFFSYPNQAQRIFGGSSTPKSVVSNSGTAVSSSGGSDFESSVINTVKAAKPAVVSIVITKDVPVYEQYYSNPPSNNPFGDFFNSPFSPFQMPMQMPQLRQKGTQQQEIGGGSGFIISPDGMIITNKHVVDQDGADYTVFTNDGTKYKATVVAKDPVNDVAVIKIDAKNLSYLQFADSNTIQVGQSVIAIGNALGEFRNSVSLGVISGTARSITAGGSIGEPEQLDEVIQTDAAINPGNSGGPLLDLHGKVVGVNVAVALGSQNVGFALPANTVSNVVDSVKKNGKIVRPFIGVRYIAITPEIQQQNKLPVDHGVLVVRGQNATDLAVVPGSPADKAGIQENDIITEADGVQLDDTHTLASAVQKKNVGDKMQLKVLHKGQEETVTVTLQELPS
jgi:serine protease Do